MSKIAHYSLKQRVIYVDDNGKHHGIIQAINYKAREVILQTFNGTTAINMNFIYPFNLVKTLNRINKLEKRTITKNNE